MDLKMSTFKKGHTIVTSQELNKGGMDSESSAGVSSLKGSSKALYKTDLLMFLKNHNVLKKQASEQGKSYDVEKSWKQQ